jgi:hypothetical protein
LADVTAELGTMSQVSLADFTAEIGCGFDNRNITGTTSSPSSQKIDVNYL